MNDFLFFAALLAIFVGPYLLVLAEGRLRRREPRRAAILAFCVLLAPLSFLAFGQARALFWDVQILLRGDAENVPELLRSIYIALFLLLALILALLSYFGKSRPHPYAPSQFSPGPSVLAASLYFIAGVLGILSAIDGRAWLRTGEVLHAITIGQAELSGTSVALGIAAVGGALTALVCLGTLLALHLKLKAGKAYQSPLFPLVVCTIALLAFFHVGASQLLGVSFLHLESSRDVHQAVLSGAFAVHGLLLLRWVDWAAPSEQDAGSAGGQPQEDQGKAFASS